MGRPVFQIGDVIVKIIPNQFRDTAITIGKPYEVIEITKRHAVILDDKKFRYDISHNLIPNRWVLAGTTNEQLVHLLKEE